MKLTINSPLNVGTCFSCCFKAFVFVFFNIFIMICLDGDFFVFT